MSESISINIETTALSAGVEEAAVEIERAIDERIVPAALLIEDAFTVAGRSIQSNLARAAQSGSLSMSRLAKSLARDLGGFAIDALVRRPVYNLVSGLLSAPFGGARVHGGFAARGQSFLVGERGPELFTPGASGMVSPMNGNSGVTVNIALPGVSDAESFRRSHTQIAAGLARAVGRGQRNL